MAPVSGAYRCPLFKNKTTRNGGGGVKLGKQCWIQNYTDGYPLSFYLFFIMIIHFSTNECGFIFTTTTKKPPISALVFLLLLEIV